MRLVVATLAVIAATSLSVLQAAAAFHAEAAAAAFTALDDPAAAVFDFPLPVGCSDAEKHVADSFAPLVPFESIRYEGYHSPSELFLLFRDLARQFPRLARIEDVTLQHGEPTFEGRSIYALKISDNVDLDEDEPNLLIVSNHHARELATPELSLSFATRLLSSYETDEEIRKTINHNQIYFIWTVNPDGLNRVWKVDRWWRKNLRPSSDGQVGVDLNRNYLIGWDLPCSGSNITSSEDYCGIAPSSEPEVRTILAFHNDRVFDRIIDFHSYAREVRTIYGSCVSLPTVIDRFFSSIDVTLAADMNYEATRSCCVGGHIHAGYALQGSLSFLVETGKEFQPNTDGLNQILSEVWPGFYRFITLKTPVAGHVRDSRNGRPVAARLTILGLDFSLGEIKRSNPRSGRFHIWLPEGQFDVLVEAEHYVPQTITVRSSGTRATVIQDIVLKRVAN